MGDFSSDSPSEFEGPTSKIHSVASDLLVKIKNLKKAVSGEDFLEVQTVCQEVKNKILDYEDEADLSVTHNNCRKLGIASKLFINICLLHDKNADFEFKKTVNDVLAVEKFNKISIRIKKKQFLESRKKKVFAELARRKIVRGRKSEESPEEATRVLEKDQSPVEDTHVQDKEAAPPNQETIDTLALPLDTSAPVDPVIHENLTMIREEIEAMELQKLSLIPREVTPLPAVQTEIPLQARVVEQTIEEIEAMELQELSLIPREVTPLPEVQTEIPLQARVVEQTIESIDEILQILDDQTGAEIIQPENILEPVEEPQIENLPAGGEQKGDAPEISDDLTLSNLESEEVIRRKRRRLIIDRNTMILNYAVRAVVLNKQIVIERIQVYEGPPSVLQSLSIEHLMKTPGFRGARTERLNILYTRHLALKKCPAETLIAPERRTFAEQQRGRDTLPIQGQTAVEDIGVRIGMQPAPERRQALSEIIPDPMVQGEPVPRALEPPRDKGPLEGIDISAVIMAAIEPPDKRRTSTFPYPPIPRIQQEQGKKPEPKKSLPWFFSVKKTPPSPKWTEFQFVREKLKQYWTFSELEGNGKAITVGEVLRLEEDYTSTNYLTLLRIVDKLSIAREVYLEGGRGDVLIMPFEIPYVSAEQTALRGKDLRF